MAQRRCAGTKARFLTEFTEEQSHREGFQCAARKAHYGFSAALLLGELGVGIFLCSTHGDAGPFARLPCSLDRRVLAGAAPLLHLKNQ